MNRNMVVCIRSGWYVLIGAILVLGGGIRASAFSAAQATSIWNSYNNSFYVGNGGNAYYRQDQGGGQDTGDFWYNAEELEMAVDRAQQSGSAGDKTIVTALVNGFDATYGSDWTNDTIYNDDIMWACLAHLRAYFVTGSTQTNWAVEAADNFNWVYNGNHSPGRVAPQYDSTYGGGMWWSTDHSSTGTKNACDNGPGALVGYYLSVVWPTGTGFLGQAQNMYTWEKTYLVNSSGYVYDHWGSSGLEGYDLSYNAGTFIGAAYLLGNFSTAGLVASYYMNNLSGAGGILPDWGTGGGNNDGFNGIFMRWMALYMYDSGTEGTYSVWLYNNAAAALSVENSSGLSWDDWSAATPTGGQYSWDCTPSVVALNVLLPTATTLNEPSVLDGGQELLNGNYAFIMQTDGNLVLYNGSTAIWASNTSGNPGAYCTMQSDGNLVVYSSSGGALWATGTNGNPGAYVTLQTDGNVVVYSSSNVALWATGT